MPKKPEPNPFPPGIGQPATRALISIGIKSVDGAATYTEAELAALHGMGPKALGIIKTALKARGKSFRKE